jgi:pimeloyl-ACP methyl ester carboxylesterase
VSLGRSKGRCAAGWSRWVKMVGRFNEKYLPQAEMQLVPACGHLGMFEKEAEFVEAVTRFCHKG